MCRLLGCDGLVIPTVTAYDPYDPPKFGASLQLFVKPGTFNRLPKLDPRALERNRHDDSAAADARRRAT